MVPGSFGIVSKNSKGKRERREGRNGETTIVTSQGIHKDPPQPKLEGVIRMWEKGGEGRVSGWDKLGRSW